ncbi:MAG: hypothetical protein QNJ91_01585 [Gammaproteobacteria bacterium]|nr:hypothetical protein [Gammaproteobacteria bacterium]
MREIHRTAPTLIVAAALLAAGAHAADGGAAQQIERLQQQVETLEARLDALESRIDAGVPTNKALKVEPKPGGWRNAANWGLLARNMPKEEVMRILGEPDNSKTIKKFEHWLYGDGRARLYLNRLKSWDIPSQATR